MEISADCKNLLTRLLQKDPRKRATFKEFFDHPFVNLGSVHLSRTSLLEAISIFERAEKLKGMNQLDEALILYRQADVLLRHLIRG